MGSRVKTWKRRWFVLRQGQILYYKSPVRPSPGKNHRATAHTHTVYGAGGRAVWLQACRVEDLAAWLALEVLGHTGDSGVVTYSRNMLGRLPRQS